MITIVRFHLLLDSLFLLLTFYTCYWEVIKTAFILVYVDADANCNEFNFQLGPTGIGATIPATRSWNLKVKLTHDVGLGLCSFLGLFEDHKTGKQQIRGRFHQHFCALFSHPFAKKSNSPITFRLYERILAKNTFV